MPPRWWRSLPFLPQLRRCFRSLAGLQVWSVSSQFDRRLFRSRVHSIDPKGKFDRSQGFDKRASDDKNWDSMHLYRLFFVLLLNISPAPFDKSTESIILQKFMEPFYYGDILMKCNSPMESWTFPIEYQNSPFDKSTESTKVYGAILLRRYFSKSR